MRKIRTASFISLDGVMQAPGGPEEDPTGGFAYGGWVWPHFDEASGGLMDEAMGRDYDLLLGRRTYEIFAPTGPGWMTRSAGPSTVSPNMSPPGRRRR